MSQLDQCQFVAVFDSIAQLTRVVELNVWFAFGLVSVIDAAAAAVGQRLQQASGGVLTMTQLNI